MAENKSAKNKNKNKKEKTPKQMEKHLKGLANHYRIAILLLIDRANGITLEKIIKIIGANKKTIGAHTNKLFSSGLVNKKYRGRYVEHTLSPYGKMFVGFLKTFKDISN